jgi:hypothetical protein
MCLEEIAQTDKRANYFDICGWLCILFCFKFVFTRFNAFRSEGESQIVNFFVAKKTFV